MHLLVRQSRDKGPHQCRLELKEASRCLLQQFPLKFGTLFFLLLSPKTRVLPVRAITQINPELAPFTRRGGAAWPLEWLTGSRTKRGHSFIPCTEGSAFPDGWGRVSFDGTSSTTLHTISRCKSQCQPNGRRDDKVIYLQSAEFSFLSLQTNVQVKCATFLQSEMWKYFHIRLKCLPPENKPAFVGFVSHIFWVLE